MTNAAEKMQEYADLLKGALNTLNETTSSEARQKAVFDCVNMLLNDRIASLEQIAASLA